MRHALAFLLIAATAQADPRPPIAARQPHPLSLHGVTLDDDWFWLRAKGTRRVTDYLRAEAAYAEAVMKPAAALRARLEKEMRSRIQEDDTSAPYRIGNYLYYYRNEKGKEHDIWARRRFPDGREEIFLDLNALAKKQKYIQLGEFEPSDDGRRLAYSTDVSGFRDFTLHVKDLQTGALGPERIRHVTSFEWAADNRTFFYVVENQAKRAYRLYRHTLGEKRDALIFEEKDERFSLEVQKSTSGRFLFLCSQSLTQTEARLLPTENPSDAWRLIAPRRAAHEYYLDHRDHQLYIRSNDTGRNFRVVTAPLATPDEKNWKELIAHRPSVMLRHAQSFKNHLVVWAFETGLPQIEVLDLRNLQTHRVSFPEAVYFAAPQDNHIFDTETFRFVYMSFITPASDYDYDAASRERKLVKRQPVPTFDPSRYQSERRFARAADGIEIPLSVVYKKGVARDGSAPLLLEGYGSYGLPFPVEFDPQLVSLLDRGVVFAVAHVRGGGELGKPWHDDGRMMKKRNTFTDFVRSAEHLIEQNFTSPGKLAIAGGSAGGLLVGAVINLRPELFRAAVAHVPFVDVINTMLDTSLPLTVGEFEEWGNPRNPDEFAYMRGYSPYDNVEKKRYPSLLVTSSLNDSQVMYWEPAKWVAKLRALKTDSNPVVLRINLDPAGHGGKSGRYEQIRESAFDYAWLLGQLGIVD